MSLDNIIFIDSYPKIDLHGYDRQTARVAINDFVKEQHKLKNYIIVIVHGIGSGILLSTTKNVLNKNRLVKDYKTFYYNQGCTVVELERWLNYLYMLLFT